MVLIEVDDCREIEKKLRGEMAKLRNILTECLPFLDARFGNSLRYRAKHILSNAQDHGHLPAKEGHE